MASLIPWDAICLILVRRGRDAVGGAEGGRGGGAGAKHREREGDGRHITGLNGMDSGRFWVHQGVWKWGWIRHRSIGCDRSEVPD